MNKESIIQVAEMESIKTTGFDKYEYIKSFGDLKDIILELFHGLEISNKNEYLTNESLNSIYDSLPDSIKDIGKKWGFSDTVFRDSACKWLEKNWISKIK